MTNVDTSQLSRYMRTSWMLSAETPLVLGDSSKIRFLTQAEVDTLSSEVQKRNLFARVKGESSFYVQQINRLANHTIVEVFLPGDPQDMAQEAEETADLIEKLAVLSSTLALPKDRLHRRLGISTRPETEVGFIVGRGFWSLKSKSRSVTPAQGLRIDVRFCRRFERCGFCTLYAYAKGDGDLAKRVQASLDWLFESRREPRLSASVVKTAIALESLLILSESEALAWSLSERTAFILSSSPDTRRQISTVIKRFYDARSGVVHGGRRKRRQLTVSLVEAVDRFAILLCLIIATNHRLWPTVSELRSWCETQRWGEPSAEVEAPFPHTYLRNAVSMGLKQP